MYTIQIKGAAAGVCFGIWPLIMNKSGLNGYMTIMVFVVFSGLMALPFALYNPGDLAQVNWRMVVWAGLFSGIGVMLYNSAIMSIVPGMKLTVSGLIVLQLVAQAVAPALYETITQGDFSPRRLLGFVCASLAVVLLNKS